MSNRTLLEQTAAGSATVRGYVVAGGRLHLSGCAPGSSTTIGELADTQARACGACLPPELSYLSSGAYLLRSAAHHLCAAVQAETVGAALAARCRALVVDSDAHLGDGGHGGGLAGVLEVVAASADNICAAAAEGCVAPGGAWLLAGEPVLLPDEAVVVHGAYRTASGRQRIWATVAGSDHYRTAGQMLYVTAQELSTGALDIVAELAGWEPYTTDQVAAAAAAVG